MPGRPGASPPDVEAPGDASRRPLDRLDDAVLARLDAIRSPTLDALLFGLSSAADHGLLWLAIGSARAARRGDPAIVARLAASLSVESALTNLVVKSLFRRLRPAHDLGETGPLPYGMHRPLTSSFPSGHAVTGFTAATLLSEGTRLGPAFFGLAAVVASSRVYTRMHHTSDVVAGAALGVAFGCVARRVLPLSGRRRGARR